MLCAINLIYKVSLDLFKILYVSGLSRDTRFDGSISTWLLLMISTTATWDLFFLGGGGTEGTQYPTTELLCGIYHNHMLFKVPRATHDDTKVLCMFNYFFIFSLHFVL